MLREAWVKEPAVLWQALDDGNYTLAMQSLGEHGLEFSPTAKAQRLCKTQQGCRLYLCLGCQLTHGQQGHLIGMIKHIACALLELGRHGGKRRLNALSQGAQGVHGQYAQKGDTKYISVANAAKAQQCSLYPPIPITQ